MEEKKKKEEEEKFALCESIGHQPLWAAAQIRRRTGRLLEIKFANLLRNRTLRVVRATWAAGAVENFCSQSSRFALATHQALYVIAYFVCINTNFTSLYHMSAIQQT